MSNFKIYFAGSIRGGRKDAELYQKIIGKLKQYGEVLTEHVGDDRLLDAGESNKPDTYIHDRDIAWIQESNIVVAEVTTPSLGVGYEIASALNIGKPVICLFNSHRGRQLSAMIRGSRDLRVYEYGVFADIERILSEVF